MSESNQNILPTTQTTSVTITSFTVEINNLILFTSANFRVLLRNIEGNVVNVVFVEMSGDNYARWSNNDEYVYQFVAEQLGFTLV
jgi:hypothetical protein